MADQPTADVTLDAKGLLCPMPIVKLARAVKEMQPQQVLLLLATDPGSVPDVAAWSKNTGNRILAQDREANVMRFWIRKA